MERALDAVDLGILFALGEDARNTTATAMASRVGVSPSTVRNRLDRLEAVGVIRGYLPDVDYEAAGLALQLLFVCTARGPDRSEAVEELLEVDGVVDVRETLPDHRNVYVGGVATDAADADRLVGEIRADGLTVDRVDVVRTRRNRSCNHHYFREGAERVGDDGDDGAEIR